MEFDRRVQVRLGTFDHQANEPKTKFGSGYLVAPRLVLTAAHVIGDASGPWQGTLTVFRPQPAALTGPGTANGFPPGPDGTLFPATVRWYRKNELVDAALIEIDDGYGWQTPQSLQDIVTRPPQRWGLLIGPRPHPVTVLGFPNMQKNTAHSLRLDEQLTGEIHPGNGSVAHRYEISSTNPVLSAILAHGATGTRWSGISGAAVHSDDLLCGVTRRDRQATSGTRLTATPTALLLADDDFRTIVTERTAGWEPVLEPVEPAALLNPAASQRGLSSPAALLRADTEAVTFHGREDELADLRAWCETGPPPLSARVLTGPGGQGKTRLARHLTHLLSHAGWATGHLRSDLTDRDAPPDFGSLTTALPLLLVVDYAETRPRLLRRLITDLHRSRYRVRLLLLARSDGEWRTDALSADPRTRDLLRAAQTTELAALMPLSRPDQDQPDQDRAAAFIRAAADLACLLPHVAVLPAHDWNALAATLRPSDDLNNDRYGNVLTLQMTALVTLLQHGPAPVHITPGAPAEEVLLEHEERFWEDSADSPAFKLNLPTPTLAAAVAAAALCGAADEDEALRIIGEVPELPTDKAPRTAEWLARLYPGGPDSYWGSLQPDRIAEYHASTTLTCPGILTSLLNAASSGQQAQIITILTRAAIAHYNAHRGLKHSQVLGDLNTALDATELHPEALQRATATLPHPSHAIADLAVRLTDNLASTYRLLAASDPAAYDSDLARWLSNLGVRLSEVGRGDECLAYSEEALEIRRRLAADNPAVYESDLATSLYAWAWIRFEEKQDLSGALRATGEAVELYRKLVAATPTQFASTLRAVLRLQANLLLGLGRIREAGQVREWLATNASVLCSYEA